MYLVRISISSYRQYYLDRNDFLEHPLIACSNLNKKTAKENNNLSTEDFS